VSSILRGRIAPAELIVVDQSEVPADLPEVHVIHSPTAGSTTARNLGVTAATQDVIVFTDDDVLVEPTWLEMLVGALTEAGPRTAVTGQVLPGDEEVVGGRPMSVHVDPNPASYVGRIGREVLSGNNFAVYRSALAEVGGFDERLGPGSRFLSADDNDFGYRLLEAGYSIVYVPAAVLRHRTWRAGRDLRKVNWDYGVGQGAFYAKHMSLRDLYTARRLIRTAAWRLRRMVTRPVRRRSIGGSGDLVYVLGLLVGAGRWWIQER